MANDELSKIQSYLEVKLLMEKAKEKGGHPQFHACPGRRLLDGAGKERRFRVRLRYDEGVRRRLGLR